MTENNISRNIDFHTFITKVIEICGPDRLRTPEYVEHFMSSGTLLDSKDTRMVSDMAEGKVFSLFLDEPQDAYEKSRKILKDTYHHDDTEIRSYLDDLKDILEHMNPDEETENERMLSEAEDYAFSPDCQDYERAARLIEETTIWQCPRGNFIGLMSATKGEDNDISQILNGEPVKNKVSPGRYAKYKEFLWSVEDDEEAVDLLVECAEQGVPEAQYLLGRCYGLKEGESFVTRYIQQDEKKAEEWIEKAKKNGFTEEADPQEEEFAVIDAEHPDIDALKELAEDGYAEAQISYAETFPLESRERRTWIEKAVRKGNITAMRKLALLCQDVEDDHEGYMIWLEKAADEQDPEAEYLLGCEYLKSENEDGSDNPDYDYEEGRDLILLAADQHNFDAINKAQEIEKWENRL